MKFLALWSDGGVLNAHIKNLKKIKKQNKKINGSKN